MPLPQRVCEKNYFFSMQPFCFKFRLSKRNNDFTILGNALQDFYFAYRRIILFDNGKLHKFNKMLQESKTWKANTNQERLDWGQNFLINVLPLMADFNISQARIDVLQVGLLYSETCMKFKTRLEAYHGSFTIFHNNGYKQQLVKSAGLAAAPTLELPPAGWDPGWYDDAVALAEEMKKNKIKMTDMIASLLRIVNTITQVDPLSLKTFIKCKIGQGGFTQLNFSLLNTDAAHVFAKNASGGFDLIGSSTKGKFIDKRPLPAAGTAVVNSYKIMLLVGNVETGSYSEVVNFTVTGV